MRQTKTRKGTMRMRKRPRMRKETRMKMKMKTKTKTKTKTQTMMKTRTLDRTDAEVEDAKAGGEDGEVIERGKGWLTREPRPASQWPKRTTPMKRAERAIPLVI